jgi:hypothetical protein
MEAQYLVAARKPCPAQERVYIDAKRARIAGMRGSWIRPGSFDAATPTALFDDLKMETDSMVEPRDNLSGGAQATPAPQSVRSWLTKGGANGLESAHGGASPAGDLTPAVRMLQF